jgi:hypothetical protein
MSQLDHAWARCVRAVISVAIWFLAVEAIDPTVARVPPDRGIRAAIAIGLAMGMIPGSFLDRLVNLWRGREMKPSRAALWLLSVGIPLTLLAASLVLLAGGWQILRSLPPDADSATTRWSLIHSAGMGVIAVAALVSSAWPRRPRRGS